MNRNVSESLSAIPLFSQLNREQLEAADSTSFKRVYEPASYITHYADSWPYLFLVSRGHVDAVKMSPEGRQLNVLCLVPGDLFWGLAFFNDGAGNPVSLYSREESEIYLWRREDLLPVLMKSPDALWKLCQLMILRMQDASQIVEGLAFQAVPARLARLLVGQFSSTGERSIHRSLTLDDIAAKIGTTREQACRALYQLADEHLIEITRTEFTLTDAQGLNHLAGTD